MKWANVDMDDLPTRIEVTKFLFFPKTIGLETRWLEKATWVKRKTPWGNRRGEFWETYEDEAWGTLAEVEFAEQEKYKRLSTGTYI
jgi:hypothetical protein